MGQAARHCPRAVLLASALMVGRAPFAKSTLMTVQNNPACLEEIALTWSMTLLVTVPMDLLANDVRRKLISVPAIPVFEVSALTGYSDMSVLVKLAGLDQTVMSILMIVPSILARMVGPVLMR